MQHKQSVRKFICAPYVGPPLSLHQWDKFQACISVQDQQCRIVFGRDILGCPICVVWHVVCTTHRLPARVAFVHHWGSGSNRNLIRVRLCSNLSVNAWKRHWNCRRWKPVRVTAVIWNFEATIGFTRRGDFFVIRSLLIHYIRLTWSFPKLRVTGREWILTTHTLPNLFDWLCYFWPLRLNYSSKN